MHQLEHIVCLIIRNFSTQFPQVSALIGSQDLVSALRDALKSIKDIPRLLKVHISVYEG
jgi:hypothetical protein